MWLHEGFILRSLVASITVAKYGIASGESTYYPYNFLHSNLKVPFSVTFCAVAGLFEDAPHYSLLPPWHLYPFTHRRSPFSHSCASATVWDIVVQARSQKRLSLKKNLGNSEPMLWPHILSLNEVNELLASLPPTRTGFCSSFATREKELEHCFLSFWLPSPA